MVPATDSLCFAAGIACYIFLIRMEVFMGKFVVKETATGFKFNLKADDILGSLKNLF